MTRWAPWLLAFIVWNGAFDLQVKRAGDAFTDAQTRRWQAGQPPELIRDSFTPRVHAAAWRATLASGTVLLAALAWRRRARRVRIGSTLEP
jgi:hypothetical protein